MLRSRYSPPNTFNCKTYYLRHHVNAAADRLGAALKQKSEYLRWIKFKRSKLNNCSPNQAHDSTCPRLLRLRLDRTRSAPRWSCTYEWRSWSATPERFRSRSLSGSTSELNFWSGLGTRSRHPRLNFFSIPHHSSRNKGLSIFCPKKLLKRVNSPHQPNAHKSDLYQIIYPVQASSIWCDKLY